MKLRVGQASSVRAYIRAHSVVLIISLRALVKGEHEILLRLGPTVSVGGGWDHGTLRRHSLEV